MSRIAGSAAVPTTAWSEGRALAGKESTVSKLFKRLDAAFWFVVGAIRPLAPFLTRVVLGVSFIQTGYGKLGSLDDVASFFAQLGIPLPYANAAFIASVELFGGIALVLGLWTNLAAALLSSTMVVAILTAERQSLLGAITGNGDKAFSDILPLMFLLPLVWLVAFGAGPLSLDRLLSRLFARSSAAPASAAA